MNNSDDKKKSKVDIRDTVLSEDELVMLSAEHEIVESFDTESPRMRALRGRVMSQIDQQAELDRQATKTIRADSDDWEPLSDKIRRKMLHVDERSGMMSFLLRIDAGAEDLPHLHASDEHCLVLEGDVSFGDLHLYAGDFHLAAKGSWHERGYSEHGALVYIQTGIEQRASL